MAELLHIIEFGHPTLRQQAIDVGALESERTQQLIDDLIMTVRAVNGVGIAAPQVGEANRLFIVASHPNPRYPKAPEMEPTAMINPRILSYSSEVVKGWEGCLSVPGIRGFVPRYQEINVEYTGRDGKLCCQVLTDFVARIFQHELDHLDGIVFLDRVESSHDVLTEDEYQRQIESNDVQG